MSSTDHIDKLENTDQDQEILRYKAEISELKSKLRASEERFSMLADGVGDIIYELDRQGNFIYVNASFKELTGFSEGRIPERHYWKAVHEEDLGDVKAFYLDQLMQRKRDSYYEFRVWTKKRGLIWLGQSVTMIFENGLAERIRIVARDITHLKKTLISLKDSQTQLTNLIENVGDMIGELNEKGKFTFVNTTLLEKSQYSSKEVLGRSFIEFIHPDDQERVKELTEKQFLEKNKEQYFEFRLLLKEGGFLWIGQNTSMVFEGDNLKVARFVARDISEVVSLKNDLKQREQLYRLVSENSKDLICLHSNEGENLYVSPASVDVLGYKQEELLNKKPFRYVHPDDLNVFKRIFEGKFYDEGKFKSEYRFKHKDGRYIWLETVARLTNQDGTCRIVTSSRDVSKRKIEKQELIKAKEKAEAASDEKANFLSVISHEIRTPLNAIIGLTHLLLEEDCKPGQLEDLKLLKFSGENLLALLNNVLDVNKIEAGKLVLEHSEFDLKDLLIGIKRSQEVSANEKGLQLKLLYDDDLPRLFFGDSMRIAQIVNNLVDNAIKFTESGSVKIIAEAKAIREKEAFFKVEVVDTGIGIASENQHLIFDKFNQAEANTSRRFGGTGLGLSITKNLLELMGSEVSLLSSEYEGSTFSFELCLPLGGEFAEPSKQQIKHSFQSAKIDAKLLLIEDNEVNQLVANEFLTRWGMHVDIVDNGQEGIELLRSKKYDAILLDLQMPELDGYAIAKIIRSHPSKYFQNIPILAISASTSKDVIEKALNAGMNDFLSKPYKPSELFSKVTKTLNGYSNTCDSLPLLEKIESLTEGDQEFKSSIIKLHIKNLEELKCRFRELLVEKDLRGLSALKHKMINTVDGLKLETIQSKLEEAKIILKEKTSQNKVKSITRDFHRSCEEVIQELEKL
ncbi:MAG: PAS domain S-box protein [Bacteroidota bacterium]